MRTGLNSACARRTQAVNARDLPGRVAARTRPGGLTTRRPASEGRVAVTRPHEDTAQSSGYVVLAGWSIESGYNSATAPKTFNPSLQTLNVSQVFQATAARLDGVLPNAPLRPSCGRCRWRPQAERAGWPRRPSRRTPGRLARRARPAPPRRSARRAPE